MVYNNRNISLSILIKLFLLLVPIRSLVLFIIGGIFLMLDETARVLGFLAINVGIYIVLMKLSMVAHEFGHWVGARLVGEYPRRVVLGKGHVLLRTHFFKTKLNIFNEFDSAYIITIFSNNKKYTFRRFVYTVIGPMANLFLAVLFLTVFPFSYVFVGNICVGVIGGTVNIFLFVGNLLPYKTRINNIISNSDGLQIWKLFFSQRKQEDNDSLLNDFLDAEEALHEKDYGKALLLFEACIPRIEDHKSLIRYACLANAGICKGQLGDIEGYYVMTKAIDDEVGSDMPEQIAGPIYHNLASIFLIKGQLENATHYIQRAIKYSPNQLEVQIMHGSILIMSGEFDQGIDILIPTVNFSYPNNNTISAAMYLALGYHSKGNERKKEKYWKFVAEHEHLLSHHERQNYYTLSEKLNMRNSRGTENIS